MRILTKVLSCLLLILALAPSRAGLLAAQEQLPVEAIVTAPVEVDGDVLFEVRGVSSYPAATRAETIATRIVSAARAKTYDSSKLILKPVSIGIELRNDKQIIFTLVEADARLAELDLNVLADSIRSRVDEAIKNYREARSPKGIRQAIQLSLVATLVFALVVAGLFFLARMTNRLLEHSLRRNLRDLEEKARKLVQVEQYWGALKYLFRVLYGGLGLVALYYYVSTVLLTFPWTRGIANDALGLFVQPFLDTAEGVWNSIPDLIALAIIFLLTRFVLKLNKRFFFSVQSGRIKLANFEREWAQPTARLLRTALIIFALIMAFPYIPGSQSDAFKAISIFAGVMLSLGSSSVIANLVAGYSLIYRRAFQVGDRVEIAGVVGDVVEMRLQATHITTPKNERVTVPNSTVLKAQVVNYSALAKEEGLILHTKVGIGYEVPWRKVEEMLLEAADRTNGLLKNPKPFVLQTGLGDFSPVYELNAYTQDEKSMPAIYSELHANIQDVFAEEKIAIMTPHYIADPDEEKIPLGERQESS